MSNIEAVVLDLGGVLVDLNFDRTRQAFTELGAKDFDSFWSPDQQAPFFEAYETGKIDTTKFRRELNRTLKIKATDAQLDAAWNAMLVEMPQANIDLLTKLRGGFRTFLLSNTNPLHLEHLDKLCGSENCLQPYFEKTYYSFRIGARKPQLPAFEKVLRDNDLVPSRTLFVDDRMDNVKAGRAVGMQGVHLPEGTSLHKALP